MNLFLFTYFFPYKKSEPFVINEFEFMRKNAGSVSVISMYGKPAELNHAIRDQAAACYSVFSNPSNKREIFIKGLFNLSPFHHHLLEFFQQKLFLKPKKAYWFLISLLITRAILASASFKLFLKQIKHAEDPVLYFYWGDNIAWTIPYIYSKIRAGNPKIVIRFHNSDLYEGIKSGYAPLRNKIFARANSLVTISEHGKNYLVSRYPRFENKINVSLLGVFDKGINSYGRSNDIVLVSVSSLVPVKRVAFIYHALQLMNRKVTWHHFGEGPLFNDLKEEIRSSRDDLNIHLHGQVSQAELMQFYNNTRVDLFLNVSTTEGIPVSIMEALSFGIPVMASGVGGTPEIVNEKVGELINADLKTDALAERIENFFKRTQNEIAETRENARKMFLEKINAHDNYDRFYAHVANLSADATDIIKLKRVNEPEEIPAVKPALG
jgi:colanic acid/amylovoran biosynthesis glycosyltransferase